MKVCSRISRMVLMRENYAWVGLAIKNERLTLTGRDVDTRDSV